MQVEHLHSRQRFEPYAPLGGYAFVVEVLAYAARGVAAHHRFRTVGVENAHGEVGIHALSGLSYQHESVAAYTRVRRTPCYCRFLWVGNLLLHRVYVDVVVACPVHLRESYRLFHSNVFYADLVIFCLFTNAKLQQSVRSANKNENNF